MTSVVRLPSFVMLNFNGITVKKAEPAGTATRETPILFIHGMWAGAWQWDKYLDFFSRCGYTGYALNLRGHYGSKPVADLGKVSLHQYIEDARTVATAIGNPIIIGHSMGGLVALKLAELLAPPAAVAIAPAAPRGVWHLRSWGMLRAALRHAPEVILGRPIVPGKKEALALGLNRLPPVEQERAFSLMVPESGRQTFEIAVIGLVVNVSRVTCPLLVVGAADDRITPAKMVRAIARKYHAKHKEYLAFAHMIILEPGWEQVAQDIARWLERNT